MSPVESLDTEVYDSPLEIRRIELGLKFFHSLNSNSTYTEFLNTPSDRGDQKYEENEGATKPIGVCLRKLEQGDNSKEKKQHFLQQKNTKEPYTMG